MTYVLNMVGKKTKAILESYKVMLSNEIITSVIFLKELISP